MKITDVYARRILDSRGNPTVEVEIVAGKFLGRAGVPSGASTGIYEAFELRDKGVKFFGTDVTKAMFNVNKKISSRVKGLRVDEQRAVDQAMIDLDGTKNKKKLGANAILGVSMAIARAGASNYGLDLYEYLGALYSNKKFLMPIPFSNVINGGVHAGNALKFQEFMVVPVGAKSFSEATRIVSEIYHELKRLLEQSFGKIATNVGDEGGFAPPIKTPEDALEILEIAVNELGYSKKVKFAIDAAASEFYDKKKEYYQYKQVSGLRGSELIDYYINLVKSFKIISIEDPFDQDDFEHFAELTKKIGKKIQIVGDDLTVSNKDRIKIASQKNLCNSLLLKINQIGTITEALEAAHFAHSAKWNVMVSHRSGETEDSFISDLAVGIGCGQIKLGAPARGERTAKYNQLLRIEDSLGKKAKYAIFK